VTDQAKSNDESSVDMPFLDHIEELRQRLIRIFASVIIFSIIAYVFSEHLLNILVDPAGVVYFREPTGAFMVRVKVSLFCGIAVSVPVILYHFWRFIVPGLYSHESRSLFPVVTLGTVFFFGGASFCFLLVVPLAMEFLTGFGSENVKAWIDVNEYFSFVFWMCLAFGAVFELPIISYFLGRLGLISHHLLAKGRRYAVLAILILGAVITPPDIISQLMLAVPLYLLYEVSIIVVRLTGRRSTENQSKETDTE